MSDDPSMWGNCYWCVRCDLSADGEVYLFADDFSIDSSGHLTFYRSEPYMPTLVLPPGAWHGLYAASLIDGEPISFAHWKE